MKGFILSILLVFTIAGKSQNISLKELTDFLTIAPEQKDKILLGKGFVKKEEDIKGPYQTNQIAYRNNSSNERVTIRYDATSMMGSYLFYSPKHYVSLKNSIVKTYTLKDVEETAEALIEVYESKGYKLRLFKYKGIKAYDIQLTLKT